MVAPKKPMDPGTRDSPALRPVTTTVFSLSEDETFELGQTLGRGLKGGELVLLEGELGLGKTVFARGIAAGLGIPPQDVNSPSYMLVQEYGGGRAQMFHIDLYRLNGTSDIETLGLDEILSSGSVVVVEWGERLPTAYAASAITIRLHDVGEDSRRIELQRYAGAGGTAT